MSRHRRRLHVRLLRAAAVAATCGFTYRRWNLCASTALPVSTYCSANSAAHHSDSPAPRSSRWAALQQSTAADPFDLLVVGGGLTGLYTAVDAAQRGLRVALIDAADLGGGSSTSCMPHLCPGAFPYVQRAIRQRDVGWLRMAGVVLSEETTWLNVAPWCVVAPATLRWRWRGWWGRGVSRETAVRSGAVEGDPATLAHVVEPPSKSFSLFADDSPLATTTLLPALHSLEMVEYVCAAIVSTIMSVFCGPLRPNALLPRFVVEARLPGLAPASAPSSSSSSLQLRGGIVANDFALRGNTAAVSLARTAEELGVIVLSYAPVCAIQEASASTTTDMSSPNGCACTSSCAGVMLVSVRDALAAKAAAVFPPVPLDPARFPFSLWRRRQCGASSSSSADGSGTSPRRALSNQDAAATTRVFARTVVNCTGCWTDTVKAMYDGNPRDEVPAAFAGYQVYSYLIAPANAVHAAPPPPFAAPMEGQKAQRETAVLVPPLSQTTRSAALLFSSPRLSFASVMVLPWWDQCVMLGPSISSLPQFPVTASADIHTALHPVDGYAAQRQRTLSMLSSSGVSVDASRLLSCVSHIVPHIKRPKEVPWAGELLHRGYALHYSSVPLNEQTGRVATETAVSLGGQSRNAAHGVADVVRRDVPLLHVYGGAPVLARRIAEEAVDALVGHEPPLFPQETCNKIKPCRTRYLRLNTPISLRTPTVSEPMDARARLESLIKESYAERLVDVLARRTHVAYTSPVEALQALPTLASVMGDLLQWNESRRRTEIEVARHFVTSVAVSV
ncbi:hypothetical protein JKF63_05917 [Porcisia hertigi]|uniref:Glycerol-3-phosphate dehydrogenase n=1 Tax=Porcisia hertigi TaxID=2761500 RepID=A0A836I717_9TRYP|nr:hypothetical protein JKF63_05917 [Porcisia hertigi]